MVGALTGWYRSQRYGLVVMVQVTEQLAQALMDTVRRAVELHQQGYTEQAAALYEAALALDPDHPDALQLYGVLCAQCGNLPKAIALMERSLTLRPGQPFVLVNLGNALRSHGQPFRALSCYDEALAATPANVAALIERSRALVDLRRYEEAITSADAALGLDLDNAEAFVQRGTALVQLHRYDDALVAFRRATTLNPAHADAALSRAQIAHEAGLSGEAAEYGERALQLDPDRLRVQAGYLHCLLPALLDSTAEMHHTHAKYSTQVTRFASWLASHPQADPTQPLGCTPTYYLAYRELANVEVLSEFGRAWSRYFMGWQVARGLPVASLAEAHAARPRVGIVSAYLRQHSVFNVITRTFLTAFERAGWEVQAFSLSAESDEETTYAATRVQRFEQGQKGLWEWADLIRDASCDLLLYPELGMDDLTMKLAGMRLAPVQVVSWGHPETTGLPTLDYFVTGAAFEPDAAQQHYAEQLVQLPGIGCYLQSEALLPVTSYSGGIHLLSSGVNPDLPLYVCPGTPFKYLPEHDVILPLIAERAGPCQFVFFEFRQRAELSRHLFVRLAAAFTARGLDWTRHLRLLPWMSPSDFRDVCARSTAVLDTVGFSGFNTAVHALESGAPLVGWEGRMLRGRLASGTLRHLGLAELVAGDHAGFVDIAARLALEPDYAAMVRQRVADARGRVFNDEVVVDALGRFLSSAIGEARTRRAKS